MAVVQKAVGEAFRLRDAARERKAGLSRRGERPTAGDPSEPAAASVVHPGFATALHRQLARVGGNLAVSPLSIAAALAMALAGARGHTAREIEAVLQMSDSDTAHAAFAEVLRELAATGDAENPVISLAQAFWATVDARLEDAFLGLVRDNLVPGHEPCRMPGVPRRRPEHVLRRVPGPRAPGAPAPTLRVRSPARQLQLAPRGGRCAGIRPDSSDLLVCCAMASPLLWTGHHPLTQ